MIMQIMEVWLLESPQRESAGMISRKLDAALNTQTKTPFMACHPWTS